MLGSNTAIHQLTYTDDYCKSRCDADPGCTGYTKDSAQCAIHTQIGLSGDNSFWKSCYMKIPNDGKIKLSSFNWDMH